MVDARELVWNRNEPIVDDVLELISNRNVPWHEHSRVTKCDCVDFSAMWWEMFHALSRYGACLPKTVPPTVSETDAWEIWYRGMLIEHECRDVGCYNCLSRGTGKALSDTECGSLMVKTCISRSEMVRGCIRSRRSMAPADMLLSNQKILEYYRDGFSESCGRYLLSQKDSVNSWRMAVALERNQLTSEMHSDEYIPEAVNYRQSQHPARSKEPRVLSSSRK